MLLSVFVLEELLYSVKNCEWCYCIVKIEDLRIVWHSHIRSGNLSVIPDREPLSHMLSAIVPELKELLQVNLTMVSIDLCCRYSVSVCVEEFIWDRSWLKDNLSVLVVNNVFNTFLESFPHRGEDRSSIDGYYRKSTCKIIDRIE